MSASVLEEGLRIGPYRIIRQLGSGGMGEVYLASEERLARQVALKVISPEIARNSSTLRRFQSEGRTLALINHKNVVSVYAIDKIDGYNLIAMEYIEGKSLSQLTRNLAFPATEAAPIFTQIVEGLAALHDKNVVHRDLKPHNILYSRDSVAKIIDLGIAKAFNDSQMSSTTAGVVVGTVQYLAPEIIMGRPATSLSDIWALGAIFYEFLTGRQLIKATNFAQALNQVINLKIEYPPEAAVDIPVEMRAIIEKMCAGDIENRYKNAREVSRDLRKFSQMHPSQGKWVYPHCGREIVNAAAIRQDLAAMGHSEYTAKLIMFMALQEIELFNSAQVDPTKTQALANSAEEMLTDRHLNSAIRSVSRASSAHKVQRMRRLKARAVAGIAVLAALGAGVHFYMGSLPTAGTGAPSAAAATEAQPAPLAGTEPATQSPFSALNPKVLNTNLEIILKSGVAPVLGWEKLAGARSYNIEIAGDKAFTKIFAQHETQETKFSWKNPEPGQFLWRVTARDGNGQVSRPSEVAKLELTLLPPALPAELSTVSDKPVHLAWKPNPFKSKFKVLIARDANFNHVIRTESANQESLKLNLTEPGIYYAKVAAIGVQRTEVSEFSNSVAIRVTEARRIAPPTLMAPPNEAKMPFNRGDVRVLLFWSKVEGAKSFDIELALSGNFSHPFARKTATDNRLTLTKELPMGMIYWRVRVKVAGSVSAWSSPARFELQ